MAQNSTFTGASIPLWQRNLLITTAVFTVLLIAMGGILCVTQSIRDCPDWPGCFGRVYPPLETGPILEYTHRVLAALSGSLILASTIIGFVHKPRLRWLSRPPLIAGVLLLLVSYFGAVVVLRGLAAGWAAVDVASALLVVALMVTSSVFAWFRRANPAQPDRLAFHGSFARLVLFASLVVYVVLVSGVLVAEKNPLVGCLGWPIYAPAEFEGGVITIGSALRLILSLVGIGLVLAVLVQAWRSRLEKPGIYHIACWLGVAVVLIGFIQLLLIVLQLTTGLWVVYSVSTAIFWALLVALLARSGLESART